MYIINNYNFQMAFEILVHLLANIAYIDLFLRMSLIVIYVIISRKKKTQINSLSWQQDVSVWIISRFIRTTKDIIFRQNLRKPSINVITRALNCKNISYETNSNNEVSFSHRDFYMFKINIGKIFFRITDEFLLHSISANYTHYAVIKVLFWQWIYMFIRREVTLTKLIIDI